MSNNNVKDVAKNIINICNDKEYHISNLKLNLLLYFAQGESYRLTGEPMFTESLYAFGNGPISLDVYQSYCGYGAANIPKEDVLALLDNDMNLLDKVVDNYGALNVWELSDMAKEQSPWEFTRHILGAKHKINNEFIKTSFKNDDIVLAPYYSDSHEKKKETLFQKIAEAKYRKIYRTPGKNLNVINSDIKTR